MSDKSSTSNKPDSEPSARPDGLAHTAQQALASLQAAEGRLQQSAEHGAEQISAMARRSLDSLREHSARLREQARDAAESGKHYVRAEPVKAVLISAAAGALLMGLFNLLRHSRARD